MRGSRGRTPRGVSMLVVLAVAVLGLIGVPAQAKGAKGPCGAPAAHPGGGVVIIRVIPRSGDGPALGSRLCGCARVDGGCRHAFDFRPLLGKAALLAGTLERGGAEKQFVYKIACTTCTGKEDRPWSTHRSGEDNGFMAAMDRWIFHLNEKHPGSDAPCMAFLPAAQQRLHQRREKQEAE